MVSGWTNECTQIKIDGEAVNQPFIFRPPWLDGFLQGASLKFGVLVNLPSIHLIVQVLKYKKVMVMSKGKK